MQKNFSQFFIIFFIFRVTRLVLVPSLLRNILLLCKLKKSKNPNVPGQLTNLHTWVCSGETLPSDLLYEFFNVFPTGSRIANFYGSTEVMGDVTAEWFNSSADVAKSVVDGKAPIGEVIHNTVVYILDEN